MVFCCRTLLVAKSAAARAYWNVLRRITSNTVLIMIHSCGPLLLNLAVCDRKYLTNVKVPIHH